MSAPISKRKGILALSPIIVFLVVYLVPSMMVGDFYKMPISIAFIVASIWALITTKGMNLQSKIDLFSTGAANPNIMYMIWIFIFAGAFASLATGIGSVEATVNLTIAVLPSQFLLPGLFIATCFVSLSIGTSVGTVVALTPFATQLAESTGLDMAFVVAVVIGGSFFGDNLSFISDTTIAATRSQGCKMNDKFKVNLWIAALAAILALVLYGFLGNVEDAAVVSTLSSFWLILPYLIVIVTALFGLNVLLVLTLGIISSALVGIYVSGTGIVDMCAMMGDGILGMGNLIVVTLLASGLLNVIKHNGGIYFIIQWMTARIKGARGAQASIAMLVSIVNLCTANNTIAIITVGQLSKRISDKYRLDPRKVASLLDTCSCIIQCIIPYGAQILLASGLSGLSPVSFIPYLFYAWCLMLMVGLSIVFNFPKPSMVKQ